MRRSLFITILGLTSLIGATLLGLYVLHFNMKINPQPSSINHAMSYFVLWRCILYGGLCLVWPILMHWLGRFKKWDIAWIKILAKQQYWVLLFCIATELLVIQSDLNMLVKAIVAMFYL